MIGSVPPPQARLCIGVTGHCASNAAFSTHRARISATIDIILGTIDAALASESPTPVRLHSLLADGADQLVADAALAREWELVAPLPFGEALNLAINVHPHSNADARALLAGQDVTDEAIQARAAAIRAQYTQARLFALADEDEDLTAQYLAMLASPVDQAATQQFAARVSQRVALAGRVLIEQSDLILGIWDGCSHSNVGGTGHTIAAALNLGAPVVVIDANRPEDWRIHLTPESLARRAGEPASDRLKQLQELVRKALQPAGDGIWRRAAEHCGVLKAWCAMPLQIRPIPRTAMILPSSALLKKHPCLGQPPHPCCFRRDPSHWRARRHPGQKMEPLWS
jgi:hypothetical protein